MTKRRLSLFRGSFLGVLRIDDPVFYEEADAVRVRVVSVATNLTAGMDDRIAGGDVKNPDIHGCDERRHFVHKGHDRDGGARLSRHGQETISAIVPRRRRLHLRRQRRQIDRREKLGFR